MAAPAFTAPKSALAVSTGALAARTKLIECYARAFDRAVAAKLVCYHNRADDTYAVPSTSKPGEYHTVRHLGGSDWANLSCSCKGGNHGACLHRAVVASARSRHISAVLPRCTPCDPRFCDGGCPDAPESEPVKEMVRECLLCGKAIRRGATCSNCLEDELAAEEDEHDQKIRRQAAHMYEVGASDGQIDAYLGQLSADDQQTFLAAYAALEAGTEEPRETPYEAPAGEDVIWDAEQARYEDERSPESYFVEAEYYDQVQQERDGAHALQDALMSEADPVHARQVALGRSSRAVTLDGASNGYRAALAYAEAKGRDLNVMQAAAAARAINKANPLGDIFG